MVKPIDSSSNSPQSAGLGKSEDTPVMVRENPATPMPPNFRPPAWMASGPTNSASRQLQEAQIRGYQSVEGQLDRASQALSKLRAANYASPHLLREARTYLDTARILYQNNFSSNQGSFTVHEEGTLSHFDVESLNTRVNAIELSYRRASQIVA